MFNVTRLLVMLLMFSIPKIYAQEVDIESIPATEGVMLECHEQTGSPLVLTIYGESFNANVTVQRRGGENHFWVNSIMSYYNKPIYESGSQVIATVSRGFTIKDGVILQTMFQGEPFQDENKIDYGLIVQALEEAHSKGQCKSWFISKPMS